MKTYAESTNPWFTDFPPMRALPHMDQVDSYLIGRVIAKGPYSRIERGRTLGRTAFNGARNGARTIGRTAFNEIVEEMIKTGWDGWEAAGALRDAVQPKPIYKHELKLVV